MRLSSLNSNDLCFPRQRAFAIDYLRFTSCSHLQRYFQIIDVHLLAKSNCVFNLCSLIYFYCTLLLAKINNNILNNNLLIISRTVEATDLTRFVGNSILFRFFTGMDSGGLLNFFTNFKLLLSKNTGKFLIMI